MRRTRLAGRALTAPLALAALLSGAVPAAASGGGAGGGADGWEPAPTPPYDYAAGVRCDFPIHTEAVVDEVVQRVLDTYPDGSPREVVYKGPLIVRVTNTDTGAWYDADASGTALVDYRSDGSQFWSVIGPVLVGFGENAGNVPRGEYLVDGVYTLEFAADGYRTLHLLHGGTEDICAHLD
ncbi:hypothetical protein [Streptomyces hoynatensis]|uniref:Uncharacterized protein n=1 Tax=Streptomyces hoynatensis TaxID=1141874 RepID=A0A3A9YMS5_9ACTN|nr:hypothetical protein [Streptomyces hoynatensis]RKN37525.1 hypothetical protein D7294_27690 [Streptomyces hoynatensis]